MGVSIILSLFSGIKAGVCRVHFKIPTGLARLSALPGYHLYIPQRTNVQSTVCFNTGMCRGFQPGLSGSAL